MPSAMTPATATAGSKALGSTRGAHPTLRLDSFLRSTDAGYQHAEPQTHGDRFIRKMATYGHVRPSVSFTSEPRVSRAMKEHGAIDMSNLPNPFMDPRGDPREGTLSYPQPPKEIDDGFVQCYKNHSLMLPSERYKEHIYMKQAEKKWHEDRETVFRYRKRMQVLERHYPGGVVGIDGPTHPGTELYAERRQHLVNQQDRRSGHDARRADYLDDQQMAQDATAFRNYGSAPNLPRSRDICIQRKCVDRQLHPVRFMDTHERLFPDFMPEWDPERAAAIRSHETRGRRYDPISGVENTPAYKVAERWEPPPLHGMPHSKKSGHEVSSQP